jgi:transporter family protein
MLKHGFIFAILGAICYGMAPLFAKAGLGKTEALLGLSIRSFVIVITLLIILTASGSINKLQQLDLKTILLLAGEGLLAGLLHWPKGLERF